MPDKPIVFRTLTNIKEAEKIGEQLALHHIAYEIESPPQLLDRNFIGEQPMPEHYLKIQSADFVKANEIVDNLYRAFATTVEDDYYLFDFSIEQLKEVIGNRNEWGDLNYHLALVLLEKKAATGTDIQFAANPEQNIIEVIQPVPVSIWILATGYFCLLIPPFLYGYPAVGSLFIGWFIVGASKTSSTGVKYPIYNKASRIHGKVMIILSVIIIVLIVLYLYDQSFASWLFDLFPL